MMPLLEGARNTVSPPLERIYLLTENTSIPEGYSTVYHYDSIPESLPDELLENGGNATWYQSEESGTDVLYYLCPIGQDAGGRTVLRNRNAAAGRDCPVPAG